MSFNKRKHSPLLQRGGGLADALPTLWGKATGPILPLLVDVFRLLPDSILFGSAFLALVSQSFPMAVFVVSMLEATVAGSLLRKFMTYIDVSRSLPPMSDDPGMCLPSTFAPSLESLVFFRDDSIGSAFPSFPLYILSVASSYVIGSVWTQKRELEALGPQYAARFYIAIAVTSILIFTMMAYRIAYSCDGAGTLILTFLVGGLIGGLLLYQNLYLLGRDSTNFAGIPLLRDRTKDGKPLYVCTKKTT